VVERKNWTIVSAATAMIHDQGLQMYLWVEACSTVVYVQNRNPHQRLGDITPEEAFTGEKPGISRLRIFGCPVYIHVPREKRTKLNPAGKQGTYVGYSESVKAYRIYIPDQRKMDLSRDVTFEEDVAYRRSKRTNSDSDDSQELLASPSPPAEKETMEDDVIEPIDLVDPMIPDPVPRDIAVMGQKRRPTWARQTLQDAKGHVAPCSFRERKRP